MEFERKEIKAFDAPPEDSSKVTDSLGSQSVCGGLPEGDLSDLQTPFDLKHSSQLKLPSEEVPVYVDEEFNVSWVRLSQCPREQQEPLHNWLVEKDRQLPSVEGINPQDAVYLWDYNAFLSDFAR